MNGDFFGDGGPCQQTNGRAHGQGFRSARGVRVFFVYQPFSPGKSNFNHHIKKNI